MPPATRLIPRQVPADRSAAVFAVVALGGLDRVGEHDRRRQHDEPTNRPHDQVAPRRRRSRPRTRRRSRPRPPRTGRSRPAGRSTPTGPPGRGGAGPDRGRASETVRADRVGHGSQPAPSSRSAMAAPMTSREKCAWASRWLMSSSSGSGWASHAASGRGVGRRRTTGSPSAAQLERRRGRGRPPTGRRAMRGLDRRVAEALPGGGEGDHVGGGVEVGTVGERAVDDAACGHRPGPARARGRSPNSAVAQQPVGGRPAASARARARGHVLAVDGPHRVGDQQLVVGAPPAARGSGRGRPSRDAVSKPL